MDEQETSGIRWQDVLVVPVRRWNVVLTVFVLGVTVSVIMAFLQDPSYEASAKLMVSSDRARITVSPDSSTGATVERITDQDLNSEVALLKSPALVREVLEPSRDQVKQQPPAGLVQRIMGAVRYPLELPGLLYRRVHHVAPPSPFESYVDALAERVTVTPIKSSNLIQVTFTGSNAEWTAEFVNKLAAHHVERHARLKQQSDALDFLESQRQLLSTKMRQAEETLAQFYDRQGADAGFEQRTGSRKRLAELETALANSSTELAEATARVQFLSTPRTRPKAASMEPGPALGDPLQHIGARILELQLQRSDLLSKFAPASLKIQEMDRQIEAAKQLLAKEEKPGGGVGPALLDPASSEDLSRTEVQMAAVKARVEALRAQIADCRAKLDHLDQIAPEQESLERDVASSKESLLNYTKKVEAARFSDALDQSRIVNISVVETAEVPEARRQKKSMTVLIAAIMSLAAGAVLAFLLDWIDPAVKSAAEAETVSGLAILADIPQ